jgi:hypothetical protein
VTISGYTLLTRKLGDSKGRNVMLCWSIRCVEKHVTLKHFILAMKKI